MKKILILIAIMIGLLPPLLACAPQSVATPSPVTSTPIVPLVANPQLPAPILSAAEVEWAKVVEAAKKEGKVTLYTFFFISRALDIANVFEEKYPQIKLEFVALAGAPRVERLKVEQRMRQYIADTSDGSIALQTSVKNEGLLVPAGELPSLKEAVWYSSPQIDSEGYFISLFPTYMTFWFNTTQLKSGEEPKSLKDLLDPKWKGKIIQVEPATSSMSPFMYTGYTKYGKADDDYFRQLGSQWRFVTGSTRDAGMALARGETPLAWGSTNSNNPLILNGAPIKPFVLQEGALLIPATAFSIVKNAPHPNASRVFINWLMSKEGQTAVMSNQGMKSLRKDVPDMSPPASQIDWKVPIALTKDDIDYVDQVFSSRKLVDMWGRK